MIEADPPVTDGGAKQEQAVTIPVDDRPIRIEKPETVAVVKVEDYTPAAVKQGLQRLLELLDPTFMKQSLEGKTVFLKVNGLTVKPLACTNNIVVEELGKLLRDNGCKKVLVGDSNFNKALTSITLKGMGIAAVAERLGNPVVNFFEHGWTPVSHVSFLADSFVSIPEPVAKADIVINLPKMKTHAGYVFTGAIKNFFGLNAHKNRMHAIHKNKVDFQQMLGDIHQAALASAPGSETKPVLHVMDGIVGMEGKKGPAGGTARAFKVLIGSFSPVAVDTVAYTLMGGDPADLEAIQSLGKRNGWPSTIDQLRVVGDDWKPLVQRASLPPLSTLRSGEQGEASAGGFMMWATQVVIRVNRRRCKGCLTCVKHCPAQALSKKGNKIVLDSSKCISCFACGESCPNDALVPRIRLTELLERILFVSLIVAAIVIVIVLLATLPYT
ncbi:MAG: DUF362 domain-containing protein [Candidatus Lokiarchaeota archaeon]|nr:DUF362 domain-containing protein [Candidatus Lokiarchaeota archaeon]